MFDSKFNSKQSSTQDLANRIFEFENLEYRNRNTTSVQTSILGKRILLADKSIISHCYSQIWQLLQHVSLSFSSEAAKKLRVVL